MKFVARAFVPALMVAAGALALTPAQALAGHGCKSDIETEATVPGVGPHAKRHATRAAIGAWKRTVAAKHGWAYTSWSRAKDRDVRCDSGRGKTECEVEANPCL
ncbi:MAG: hypothetical protein ACT4N2_15610 [Hyphomicrobium sp.]